MEDRNQSIRMKNETFQTKMKHHIEFNLTNRMKNQTFRIKIKGGFGKSKKVWPIESK